LASDWALDWALVRGWHLPVTAATAATTQPATETRVGTAVTPTAVTPTMPAMVVPEPAVLPVPVLGSFLDL
jgi:hypothetical protein